MIEVAPASKERFFRHVILGVLMVVPWLNPYAAGPSPAVWPWLISACCAVGVWAGRRDLDAHIIALSWLAAASASSTMALIQYFGVASEFGTWLSQSRAGEAFANLRQRNHFATLTSIGLVSLVVVISNWRPSPKAFSLAGVMVVLLAAGAAASGSRTGLLQWVLVALSAAWYLRKNRVMLVFCLSALLAYATLIWTLPILLMRLTGASAGALLARFAERPGCSGRGVMWSNVIDLTWQKPWTGWGWGELDYAHFITLYGGARFCEILDNAHNLPLQLAVELGLPIASAVVIAVVVVVLRNKPWRDSCSSRQLAWGVLAVISLHSMLEYPLWYGPFQIALGLCCWLLWIRAGEKKLASIRVFPPRANAVIAAMALTGLLGAGFCYWRVSQIYLAPEARHAGYRDDTLNKLRGTPVFHNQLQFAELTITPLRRENAAAMFESSRDLLHYSPEPKVIEKLLDSAALIGREDDLVFYGARYRAAFPVDYARWAARQSIPLK